MRKKTRMRDIGDSGIQGLSFSTEYQWIRRESKNHSKKDIAHAQYCNVMQNVLKHRVLKMTGALYKGDISLYVWKEGKKGFHQFVKSDIELCFQPYKGLQVSLGLGRYTIHDISWDIDEQKFNIAVFDIERIVEKDFLDLDYFLWQAQRDGWDHIGFIDDDGRFAEIFFREEASANGRLDDDGEAKMKEEYLVSTLQLIRQDVVAISTYLERNVWNILIVILLVGSILISLFR